MAKFAFDTVTWRAIDRMPKDVRESFFVTVAREVLLDNSGGKVLTRDVTLTDRTLEQRLTAFWRRRVRFVVGEMSWRSRVLLKKAGNGGYVEHVAAVDREWARRRGNEL